MTPRGSCISLAPLETPVDKRRGKPKVSKAQSTSRNYPDSAPEHLPAAGQSPASSPSAPTSQVRLIGSFQGGGDRRHQSGHVACSAEVASAQAPSNTVGRRARNTLLFHALISAPFGVLLFTPLWAVGLCLGSLVLTLSWLEAGGRVPGWLLAKGPGSEE